MAVVQKVAEIEVRPLEQGDDRSTFRSGNDDLDRFFRRYAAQNQFKHHIGTTYVAVENGNIVGYATVTVAHVESAVVSQALRRRLPAYPVPVLRLARLAVGERSTGKGIGLVLLRAVFVIAHRLESDVGCVGIVVDAKSQAVSFYERYGFVTLDVEAGNLGDRPEPMVMFLPLNAIPRL